MFNYSITIWLLFFFIYCFMGWIWETIYESARHGHYINRGFLNGPFIPIYGFGALFCLIIYDMVASNIYLYLFVSIILATLMELATGLIMERIFKVRYWDYSHIPWNIKGYIAPQISVFWGLLSLLIPRLLQPNIANFVMRFDYDILELVTYILTIYFVVDITLSVIDALNLRHILMVLDENQLVKKYKSYTQAIENNVTKLSRLSKDNYEFLIKNFYDIDNRSSSHRRILAMLKRNPTAVSKKYSQALKQIQNHLKNRF